MQIKEALLASAKDPKGGVGVIRGIGLRGLPTNIDDPILEGYFLSGLLVWVGGIGWICLRTVMQYEGARKNSTTRNR